MAWNPAYLELHLSGGASNSTVANSLGGIMSSTKVVAATCSAPTNVTGVTILDAPGSTPGNGTLAFTASGTLATWTPSGGTVGAAVNIGTNGRYALKGTNADASDAYLFINVTASSLPGTNKSDTITVTAKSNGLFDDISKAESFAGLTDYRAFYIKNASGTDALIGCKLYIGSNTSGVDDISIGLGTSAIGDGSTSPEQTIASKITAPSGVSFSQPTNTGTALDVGALGAGQCKAVWMQRICPSGVLTADNADISSIVVYPIY